MGSTHLRPLHQQVVVITGASSGIGRETALRFAEHGAAVVPIARSDDALATLKQEIERVGGRAEPITADVTDWEQVKRAAEEAVRRFGRLDTWVNNAAVSLYATVEDAGIDEIRRVVDVILMGQIHGMKAALPHLKRQGRGAIINVASVLARRSVPLQAAYCAAKHAVKGFTESLRLELEHENSGISVTLILPSSINTPLFEHARSKIGTAPRPIPPVYEPRAVAEAILFAAQHPRREITVGGAGEILELLERLDPRLADAFMLRRGNAFKQQKTGRPDDARDNLYEPMEGTGRTTGRFGEKSKSVSSYTRWLGQHPGRERLVTVTVAGGVAAGLGLAFGAARAALSSRRRARTPRARAFRGERLAREAEDVATAPLRP
jgi:NAD(P)-dependent dehydrogenase (short-subunit alcohol dehydrogenase family)